MNVVILDNYDSFTFNLAQLIGEISGGCLPTVVRNDKIDLAGLRDLQPDRLIISPGPGSPEKPEYFGVCRQAILELGPTVPILGICLGLLGMVEALGGRVVRAAAPRHGKTSEIHHQGQSVFAGLPSPLAGMRYHSLIADRETLPDCFELTAWTDDGLVMAVQHRQWPIVGLQFHPESIGTPHGKELVAAFLVNTP